MAGKGLGAPPRNVGDETMKRYRVFVEGEVQTVAVTADSPEAAVHAARPCFAEVGIEIDREGLRVSVVCEGAVQ